MFFVAKSVFWLSVVALAMPGGDIEARKAGVAVAALARLAAPAAALIADPSASAGAGPKCLAVSQCRAALTQLIQASLAQDDYADTPAAGASPACPGELIFRVSSIGSQQSGRGAGASSCAGQPA